MKRIYIAAPFELLHEAQLLAIRLEARGHEIISSWHNMLHPPEPVRSSPAYQGEMAIQDIKDIEESNLLILLNPEEYRAKGTGGRHFELGYAYKARKACLILGVRATALHWCPDIHQLPYDTPFEHLFEYIETYCL